MAVVCILAAPGIHPAIAQAALPTPLTAEQIVERMQFQIQAQAAELKHLKSIRQYRVEYRGFPANLEAGMEVEYNYDASSGKSLRIISQSGSRFLCEKVLKRAVDGEKEASHDKNSTALTPANYRFHLAGSESLAGRPAYLLDVEPLVASKFLYRGKIWVDATEFALVKIDAVPAVSPSFWITRTLIRQSFAKTGDFWLPERNQSETRVRIGGTAEFTIDYGRYEIESNASQ